MEASKFWMVVGRCEMTDDWDGHTPIFDYKKDAENYAIASAADNPEHVFFVLEAVRACTFGVVWKDDLIEARDEDVKTFRVR